MKSISQHNIPLFIAFRVLFNARWYYPILAILFLDLGLTLEQYALLNVAWAISIVCLEVPSGALADRVGRRRIVTLAGLFMVVEMCLFAFAPQGSPLLFPMLLMNRILSGAAEACASGADEALAYDSLREDGRETEWPSVLRRLMQWQSAAFFIAMLAGSALYDAALVQRVLDVFGIASTVSPAQTLRWPLYLTLANAAVVFVVTLGFREPSVGQAQAAVSVRGVLRQIADAARLILHTPVLLFVILAGLAIDSIVRFYLTVESNYLRLIGLPEASFGVIGSAFALLGLAAAPLAQGLADRRSLRVNFLLTGLFGVVGFALSAPLWKYWGVLAVVPIGIAMNFVQFFVSHYLNQRVTDSSRRATVLSFKGLSFNLAYGGVGLLFAGYSRARSGDLSQDATFAEMLKILPWYLGVVVLALALSSWRAPALGPSPRT